MFCPEPGRIFLERILVTDWTVWHGRFAQIEGTIPGLPDPFYQRVGGEAQMRPDSNTTAPEERRSPWLGIIKFLFIVLLTIIIFLLGQDMVRHRFFRGGWVDRQDTLRP